MSAVGLEPKSKLRHYPLCVGGVRDKRAVHQLVAEHFNGECPPVLEVNHANGWKPKNWASNLEYETPKGKIHHAWRTGLCGELAMSDIAH